MNGNEVMTSEEFVRFMASPSAKRNKRNKCGAVRTEYGGRVYDSKAEAAYAMRLDMMVIWDEIKRWEPQPIYMLGEDFKYRADFIVIGNDGSQWVVDVKGHEMQRFRQAKKLWKKYGPLPLHIVKKGGAVEVVNGGAS